MMKGIRSVVEKILISLGKNELGLLKNMSAAAPSEDWHYFDKPTSQLSYEMNSFGMKRPNHEPQGVSEALDGIVRARFHVTFDRLSTDRRQIS